MSEDRVKGGGARAGGKRLYTLPVAVRIGVLEMPAGTKVDLWPDQIARIEATAKRAAEPDKKREG